MEQNDPQLQNAPEELPEMQESEMTEVRLPEEDGSSNFFGDAMRDRLQAIEAEPEPELTEVTEPAPEPEEPAAQEPTEESTETEEEEEDFLSEDDLFSAEEETEPEDPPEDHIRERLKIEGKERKRLEKELETRDADMARLESKIEELEKENQRATYHEVDPKSDPEFQGKVSSLQKKLDNALSMQDPKTDKVFENWHRYLEDMWSLEDFEADKKREGLSELRLRVGKDMGLVGDDVTELDPEYDPDVFQRVNSVLGVFQQYTGEVDKLRDMHDDILEKSKNKAHAFGYEEYQHRTEPLRSKLSAIEELTDRDVEADPRGLESLAAKKIKMSKDAARKAEKLDDMLIEFVNGPLALDQNALDRLTNAGKNMVEIEKARNAKVDDNRMKYLPRIKALLVLYPEIMKALPEFFEENEKKMSRQEAKLALKKTARKDKPTAETPEKAPPSREDMFAHLGILKK